MDYLTLSYYEDEEIGRPPLPKDSLRGVAGCQWVCDSLKVPYQSVCITQWNHEDEIVCQMSVREAVDSDLVILV